MAAERTSMPPTEAEPHQTTHSTRTSTNEPVPADSMVTVRLSDTSVSEESGFAPGAAVEAFKEASDDIENENEDNAPGELNRLSTTFQISPPHTGVARDDITADESAELGEPKHHSVENDLMEDQTEEEPPNNIAEESAPRHGSKASGEQSIASSERSASAHSSGSGVDEVDWDELERNEEQEPRDEGSDESTAFLLARLEQENNALATDPKAGLSKSKEKRFSRQRNQARPPSIHHLKKLVDEPTRPSLRYSLLPAPPPMTDLEFYAALVADYPRTAQCLPTLLSKKIRSGIPPPLRGVVWLSMAGARDSLLEDQYEALCSETSPYENMIGKDIGRSFPGVEMFRDPDGEGQKMLGQVLKCFSLYDQKIGYCQGLGFVVGPLLMHMGGKEAFCVLVRFMEQYDLRSCFLPDLSGLHLRIYQFKQLLTQHLPAISAHLEKLQIEPAYLSQWFLSFFGVTCPVPLLLRIYDVIFAEGAAETMMRVALSVMRRNEKKILASIEFEDVMQLLLSRGLWDTYGCDADDLVNDFVGLTGVVTHEGLQSLETAFNNGKHGDSFTKLESSPILQAATSSFLGRLWTSSPAQPKSSATLAPGLSVPSRPSSFLRRSPSKQSVASTLNSIEGGSDSNASTLPTDPSVMSRETSADCSSLKSPSQTMSLTAAASGQKSPSKDRDLHGQIEDLLRAMSEMQREQSVLVAQLQKEREERDEDRKAVAALVDQIKTQNDPDAAEDIDSEVAPAEITEDANEIDEEVEGAERKPSLAANVSPPEDVSKALGAVESRLAIMRHPRLSTIQESKHELRAELNKSKEQYGLEVARYQEVERRLSQQDLELITLRDELKDARARIRDTHQEKQRLEQTIQDLSSRKSSMTSLESLGEISTATTSPVAAEARSSVYGGLREFKLNRSPSSRSQTTPTFSKRTSSLNATALLLPDEPDASPPPGASPSAEQESLLAELVQSKTAEAVAKQEAEELRSKLESLRKLIAAPTSAVGTRSSHRASPSQPAAGEKKASTTTPLSASASASSNPAPLINTTVPTTASIEPLKTSPGVTPPATSGGGFWSGWGKRSFSSQAVPTTTSQ